MPDKQSADSWPSGEQYSIAHDSAAAVITEVGATLRSYTVDGVHVIDGFDVSKRASDGRGQVLAPWPNRLKDGRYHYGSHDVQAPINETATASAIHGLVRWLDWALIAQESSLVSLACVVHPQPGYEWQLRLEATYELDSSGLTVTTRATSLDSDRAPFGLGFHPYLTLGAASIDNYELRLPARSILKSTAADFQHAPVAGTNVDFATGRQIGSTHLDTAMCDLQRDGDGLAVAHLADDETGRATSLWVDDGYKYLMVYTADAVSDPVRRRASIAIEPMTCPPNALRSGIDLIELDPGDSWTGRWGLAPRLG